jgi:NAD+ kinase
LRKIAVVAHPNLPEALEEAQKVIAFLQRYQVHTALGLLHDQDVARQVADGEFDLVIVLGGDGSMLRAGHLCGPSGVPILA